MGFIKPVKLSRTGANGKHRYAVLFMPRFYLLQRQPGLCDATVEDSPPNNRTVLRVYDA